MRRRVALVLAALIAGWSGPAPAGDPASAPAAQIGDEAPDFEGLPPGPGRRAVYFTCTACHSAQQFTQQRLSREDWDALLDWMVANNGMAKPKPWARTLMLSYLSTHFGVETEDYGGLVPGEGREDVFYACQACHSLKLVLQQRLSRDSWAETLDWMVEEQGMPPLEPDERERILGYLARYLSPETPR